MAAANEPNEVNTTLNIAASNGQLDVVQHLVGQRALFEEVDTDGRTPLHCASRNGHLDVVQYLVGIGALVEPVDNSGLTPLDLASRNGHFNVVQYLDGQRAQPEAIAGTTSNQGDVTINVNVSGSATCSNNKMTGQEVNIQK